MEHCPNEFSKTIMIVSGSSGGHFFPALSLALKLESLGKKVVLVFPQRVEDLGVEIHEFGIKYVSVPEDHVLEIARKAAKAISFYKPGFVVGFGGIVSVPFVALARLRGIKVMIHEQNAVFGAANNLLRFIANKVALTFSSNLLEHNKKYFLSGMPVRDVFSRGYDSILESSERKKKRILVLGGSQGSLFLNRAIIKFILEDIHNLNQHIVVTHLTGKGKVNQELREAYTRSGVEYEMLEFSSDMARLYNEADLVISRAGAGTLAEVAYHRIPLLLIPYPHAGAHQVKNATEFAKDGAAIVIEESVFELNHFSSMINKLLTSEAVREPMLKAQTKVFSGDAVNSIVKEISSLIN